MTTLYDEARQSLIQILREDPFFVRYVMRTPRVEPVSEVTVVMGPPTVTPADVLGERCQAAFWSLWEKTRFRRLEGLSLPPSPMGFTDEENERVWLAQRILHAQVFLWSNEIIRECVASPLPPHVFGREQMPFDEMWWTYEGGRDQEDGFELQWVFLYDNDAGVVVITGGFSAGRPEIQVHYIPYGSRYPQDLAHSELLLAQFAFLNSPYVERRPSRPDRASRREWEKTQKSPAPEILVVKLREPLPAFAKDAPHTGRVRGLDGHWWVRGHIRAQWYPSLNAHKVIWIKPFMKGDVSRPLKQKVYAVMR